MRPSCRLRSGFRIEVRAPGGAILELREMHNLVVNVGLTALRNAIAATGFRPSHIRAGSDGSATTAGMTALVAEEVALEIDRRVNTTYGLQQQAILLASEGNGVYFREVGVFESSVLIARAVISPAIYKHSGIELTFSHTLTLEAIP